ncbi:MAG: ABC transporter permease [Vicinamibacteria bacterium]
MHNLISDLRYGFRMMRKAPMFTAIATLSLALGIGANTALYSVTDAVLMKTLPVKDPEQLVVFNWQAGKAFRTSGLRGTFVPGGYAEGMRGGSPFQKRLFEQMRDTQRNDAHSPLSSVFAYSDIDNVTLVADHQAEEIPAQVVSGEYFASLGVKPGLGRLIGPADDAPGAVPVAVISHAYWQARFASDPSVVGRTVRLNQSEFAIIGVTAVGFEPPVQVGTTPISISTPLSTEPILNRAHPLVDKPGKPAAWFLYVMGRLKPGATLAQAAASLDGPFQALAMEMMPAPTKPDQPATLSTKELPHLLARDGARGPWEVRSIYASTIYLLFGVVGLVLLIACANVANLLLTRAAQRASEITVRLALGAGRGRLMQQLLTESLMLSCLGGALGALFAVWGKDALAAVGAFGAILPTDIDYALNWRVLSFTIVVSVVTGVLFGFVPAWRSASLDLAPALKDGAKGSSSIARSWFSRSLVVGQVAVSLVLLVGAGLFMRTLLNLQRVEVGFNQERLLSFSLRPGSAGYSGVRGNELYKTVVERLDALPGVRAATFAQMPLLAHYMYTESLILPGENRKSAPDRETRLLVVRENFLEAMEIGLLRGRALTDQDTEAGLKVAVVSESLARDYFKGKDPIGQRVSFEGNDPSEFEIVGVTRDIKYTSQREEQGALIYVPWKQWAEPMSGMTFSVRTAGDPLSLAKTIQEMVRSVDDSLPISAMMAQTARSNETLSEETMYARLVGMFGGLALLLSAIGLYGVLSYSVTQRTSEIGIRMALGARSADVVGLVVRQALILSGIGVVVGAFAAVALRSVIASRLWGVEAADPLTFAAMAGALFFTALIACSVPARRATKVEPLKALRCE